MKNNKKTFVLWLTGLSASGKTTLASATAQELKNLGYDVHHLDGDEVRANLPVDLGFTKEGRDKNIEMAIDLAKKYQNQGKIVIASFITPYKEHRKWGRERLNNYIEVFADCPLHVCEKRDPKKLYQKARKGEVKNFTGIDDPYEEPEKADINVKTHQYTLDESREIIIEYLKENSLIL